MNMMEYQKEIKKKRVPWSHFDRLLNCFRKDTRIFRISDDDKANVIQNVEMSMSNMIDFWDGGIEDANTRLMMLDILEAASKLEIYDKTKEAGWSIKRIS